LIRPILPGSTVGVLGSGQLGRMFAIAARRMGYRVHTFSPDRDTPTGQVADVEVIADYNDLDAVRAFARGVSVVTFEFENIPSATAEAATEFGPVRPSGQVLHITQHRLREKAFLSNAGFPVAPHAAVHSLDELQAALGRIGCPAVLKTAGWGYDGKGQIRILDPRDAPAAWQAAGVDEAVVEAWIPCEQELSVVAARGVDGKVVNYGPISNKHHNHILDFSLAPPELPERIRRQATEMAHVVLEQLDVVGVLCVEFFLADTGELLINELAPRPHNSGHLTFDACVTSQFEQQLRAICGLPLGGTDLLCPAAMANLLGDDWQGGEPRWVEALRFPNLKLHLYGKAEARPGRKMGHMTVLARSAQEAARHVLAARAAVFGKVPAGTATMI
jgi:5-(carboxyamino)imidazole ribonucleotide synthase